jgi:hypothetical protein
MDVTFNSTVLERNAMRKDIVAIRKSHLLLRVNLASVRPLSPDNCDVEPLTANAICKERVDELRVITVAIRVEALERPWVIWFVCTLVLLEREIFVVARGLGERDVKDVEISTVSDGASNEALADEARRSSADAEGEVLLLVS